MVIWNVTKILSSVPCPVINIFWKCLWNPLISLSYSANKRRDKCSKKHNLLGSGNECATAVWCCWIKPDFLCFVAGKQLQLIHDSVRMVVVRTWTFPGFFCPSRESPSSESARQSPRALLGLWAAQRLPCSVTLWALQCVRQNRWAWMHAHV